jgi:hypothetical protein
MFKRSLLEAYRPRMTLTTDSMDEETPLAEEQLTEAYTATTSPGGVAKVELC